MTKKELRGQLLAARKKLGLDSAQQQSQALLDQFRENIAVAQGARVHLFRSLAKSNEVRTDVFFDWFHKDRPDLELVLPRVVPGKKDLDHHLYRKDDTLVSSRWGIEEPLETAPRVSPKEIDLVLVPLLAFDLRGFRIGYGGGFYDRFLAQVSSDCRTVGLSFEEGLREEPLPTDAFDVPLQMVLTPSKIFRFS